MSEPPPTPPPPNTALPPTTTTTTTVTSPPPPRRLPNLRVTTEFDSDTTQFFHKLSCKLFDNLAKLKLTFSNNNKGEIADPQLAFVSNNLSVFYDVADRNALVKGGVDIGDRLKFSATHDVKAQQGEVAMVASLAQPGYALLLSSPVPYVGLPKATFKFPVGEVSLEEFEEEEAKRKLSINGIVRGQLSNGVCTAQYEEDEMRLRYCYKDKGMSFIPSISLPSNTLSFAFKRQLSASDKLSYWYNFESNYWSAVYKHTYGRDYKFKAGYDSEVRLAWASLWVGEENGKTKTAPKKMKVQFMLQVPQDDIKSSALMFRVKKRWDI